MFVFRRASRTSALPFEVGYFQPDGQWAAHFVVVAEAVSALAASKLVNHLNGGDALKSMMHGDFVWR